MPRVKLWFYPDCCGLSWIPGVLTKFLALKPYGCFEEQRDNFHVKLLLPHEATHIHFTKKRRSDEGAVPPHKQP